MADELEFRQEPHQLFEHGPLEVKPLDPPLGLIYGLSFRYGARNVRSSNVVEIGQRASGEGQEIHQHAPAEQAGIPEEVRRGNEAANEVVDGLGE